MGRRKEVLRPISVTALIPGGVATCQIVIYGVTIATTRDPEFRSEFYQRRLNASMRNLAVLWDTAREMEAPWRTARK